VDVYLYEIQGVDFIFKVRRNKGLHVFMIEDVVNVDSINSFVVKFEVKELRSFLSSHSSIIRGGPKSL
jgi:hypothetical protein